MKVSHPFNLVLSILIAELAGVIGLVFTGPSVSMWYTTLTKPFFQPPAWLFGPVWTILYLLMGISFWIIWNSHACEKKRAMWLFVAQLALNAIWSPVFFGVHSLGGAFVLIVLLWAAIVLTIRVFTKISKPAAWLLVPYILWVSFAMLLNFAIWKLN